MSLNLTAEEVARREWEIMTDPDKVRVRVPVRWFDGMCLPVEDSDEVEVATFRKLTFGDHHAIEKGVQYEVDIQRHLRSDIKVKATDLNEYRRLMLKKNLLNWTLDVPIERENGWMTHECYERIGRVCAPLMEAFLDKYEESVEISREEEEVINRQSAALFGKNSRGIADACEAVSLFCTLGNFWEKFGLDRDSLPDLPYKEYLMLKIMSGKEGDAARINSKASAAPQTRIAGRGGRARASRGVVVG